MAVTLVQYDGQVANAQADIVAAVPNPTVIVGMNFHNTDTVQRTLQLWLNNGTNSRKILQVDVAADATVTVDGRYVLASGDSVEAEADAASVVDFWISGVEVS